MQGLRVEDPGLDTAEMGPLISAHQRGVVGSYVDGADVAFRGSCPTGAGFWYPPTVLLAHTGAEPHWREEIFGPVVSVLPFDDEDEAIRLANDTEYGLSGSTLDARRRPGDPGRPRSGVGQPERELALVGAVLDAVRRHEAVGPWPRARPGRAGQRSPTSRTCSSAPKVNHTD